MAAPADARSAPAWWTLLPFLLAVAGVAVVGGLAAGSAGQTYQALELPAFAPPSWLFGPVWTVLYAMIGVAGWLLWRARGWDLAVGLWAAQLVLNLAWTPLFFAAEQYAWALADIVVLDLLVLALVGLAWGRTRVAALLLVPYLAWIGFATALTLEIVRLN